MGMLMHHTWMKQQEEEKKKTAKAVAEPVAETEEMPVKEETAPVRKTAGRRKASN